ncbi:hypothetical protein AB0I60_12860 [Actinosynnema sp. NPDC050436]|uniref:hypothetical protein n=1 Tax=Actinosynnema sp. NPDC050436 TaxID=3155659 RepID=UPI0033F9FCB3
MTRADDQRPPTPPGAGGPSGARDGWFDAGVPRPPTASPAGSRSRAVAGAVCTAGPPTAGPPGQVSAGPLLAESPASTADELSVAGLLDVVGPAHGPWQEAPPAAGSSAAGGASGTGSGAGDGWFVAGLPAARAAFPAPGPHPFLARALAERAGRGPARTDPTSPEA